MSDFLTKAVPNEEAVEFLKNKPAIPRAIFDRLLPELKARAFTVAGIESATVLQHIRDLVASIPAGADWDEVKRQIADEMSPYFAPEDPADPEAAARAEEAGNRRAELLLRLHGFQAYSAAAYQALDEQRDLFPYWQYRSMGDGKVRDTHRALNGIVLPAGDEFWKGHYPPWEWGCRCQVVGLMDIDVDEIREADKNKPLEQRRIIEGEARRQLVDNGRLVKGPNEIFDVRTPKDKGKEGAFAWDPADMRLSIEDLKARYDAPVWDAFEAWAKQASIPEYKLTVWEWLSGNRTVPPTAPTKLPPQPARTIEDILKAAGLGTKIKWEEADVLALRKALTQTDKLTAADKISTVAGNALTKSGAGSAAWVREQFGEILGMLPRSIAEALPMVSIEIVKRAGGAFGDYNPDTNTIRVAYETIMNSPAGIGQLHETLWHETMHWIHLKGPEAYRDLITQHYRARTAGEALEPSQYGGVGRKDRWWDEYAGKQYVGAPFDPDPEGRGIELPTRYFQLLANPARFIRQLDPIFQPNADVFLDTLKQVLKIFADDFK